MVPVHDTPVILESVLLQNVGVMRHQVCSDPKLSRLLTTDGRDVVMVSDRRARRDAYAAFQRLSEDTRGAITPGGELKGWQRLVKVVGPDLAVVSAEVVSLIGMVDAFVKATFDNAMRDYVQDGNADATLAVMRNVHGEFRDRVTEQALHTMEVANSVADAETVEVLITSEAILLCNDGLHYFTDMLKATERYLADSMDDVEYEKWARRSAVPWYDRCDKWDSVSGRKNLPLLGDRG